MQNTEHLTRIRLAELEEVRAYFAPGMRVLELGGGNGYQASILKSWGCEVTSIDVPRRKRHAAHYHPVIEYDGGTIPFDAASFDTVFSSNVLEHIAHRELTLREIRRVLVPGGQSIHIVPSSTWRFWTSFSHYVAGIKLLIHRAHVPTDISLGEAMPTNWRNIAFAPIHGEYRTLFRELLAYRRTAWRKTFATNGFAVATARGNRLFYTGYSVLPAVSIRVRRHLSLLLGSSCHIFISRP